MSFEKLFNNQEKPEDKMKNTNEFREALSTGKLEEAEQFLQNVFENPENFPNYDERWLDHRQRELFQSFYQMQDWQGAKRIVENTKDVGSQEGRKARLEELSGLKYEEI
ncbi:MAG: hypothetical protein ACLFNO_01275 [Parcubacteria group bacterium]